MYLVTNDPVVYFVWAAVTVVVILGAALLMTLGKMIYRLIRWLTTKPPVAVKSGDVIMLRSGEWGKVGAGYDDDTWLVDVPAFSDFRVVNRISRKDMRPI